MSHPNQVHIIFSSRRAKLREALSGVVHVGDTLWVVNDETTYLERFSLKGKDADGSPVFANHTRFPLADYLDLPDTTDQEVDAEGLAFADGYLWVVGSHSLTREKPDDKADAETAFRQLATLNRAGNRYLLARIPLDAHQTPRSQIPQGNITLQAALLRGDRNGNELTEALRNDPHLQAFLVIPGKDNGLDIEGLAVNGQRVFLGLRGPVLRGWACILELQPLADATDPTLLRLAPIGPDGQLYRKHFLKLDGLGIRDLCVHGEDILILAGPTMSAEGAERIYRWQGGANPQQESAVDGKTLRLVRELPVSEDDHPEGICLFPASNDKPDLLVVYDPAERSRLPDKKTVTADLFQLDD